ncbi:MAG: hypothetical protein EHM57_04090, partial [Actinobacteria bacterium]
MRNTGFRQPRRLAAAAWLAGVVVASATAVAAADDDPVTRLGRTRWTHGNSVRLLAFPEESWQARFELVERARHHVFISTFAWHDDHYGELFREHLVELVRARRRENPDFTVYCLVDAIARGTFDRSFRQLEEAGAVVRSFNRQSWGVGPLYDPRMHDKMIVVDGRWGIVGGRNFADEYFEPRRWWLDFEVLLEGEAVWDLQLNFLKAWQVADMFGNADRFFLPEEIARRRISVLWTTGRLPSGRSPLDRFMTAEYFPPVAGRPGERSVAVLYDSPLVRRRAATTDLAVELIRHARAEVDLMTPFPNFTRELTDALTGAVARGTRVRLFVNGEEAVGWTVVALGVVYLLAILAFIVTGRTALYIHGVLWPSLVQNIAAHIMLGGFVWSGATLFWGIAVSVIAALFLGRRPRIIIAGAYLVAAIVFAFLEPTLQARRSQPALAVSVGMAADVFVLSVLIMVPIVVSLMGQVSLERARSEALLLNVLPRAIAERLKRSPGVIADAQDSCTVMFADIVGFTDHSSRITPEQLIGELNHIFSRFDALVDGCGAEKIKTIGDGYLAVAGAPDPRRDHAAIMCDLALRMEEAMPEINRELGYPFQLRIGLDTGRLVAGV